MSKRQGFCGGTAFLIVGPFVGIICTKDAFDPASQRLPQRPDIDRIELGFTGVGAGAPTARVKMTYDVAGDVLASNESTAMRIVRGETTATVGGAVFPVTGPFDLRRAGAVEGQIMVWVAVTAPGATGVTVRVYFVDEVP